ncbi:MAG: hypothetical protein GY710_00955 [Desulfobacteraceae bacterium]|nr:hypothetical protein [Desulfobacteraceae bacterium]
MMPETAREFIEEGKDITIHLMDEEKVRFEVCEGIIKKGLNTFLEVGRALAEIRDNRLFREAYPKYTFEKYCKEVWDLSKGYAYQQIGGYETVALLESKLSAIADNFKSETKQISDQPEEKCTDCEHRKAMANKTKGVKIPNEFGKCTRPGGLCEKQIQTESSPQQQIILPINEAQTRPLTKLSPDDQVKAWGLVLEQLNDGKKLTAALVSKAAKGVQKKVVKKNIEQTRKKVESTQLVSNLFKKQYQVMLDIISEERNNDWKSMKRTEVAKHLKALIKIVESDD